MRWLKFKKIVPPKDLSYAESLRFSGEDLEQSKQYNKKIIKLAILSFVFWIILMVTLACIKKDWTVFLNIKNYPSVLWVILTGAFGEFEILEKKKQFQELLNKASIHNETIEGDKIKEATWEEYKTISK